MLVDFIIPTYDRVIPLKCELFSLLAQTNKDWVATVVIDNLRNLEMVSAVESFEDERIRYIWTGERYNDWGHTPREIGKQASTADYIIMTGDDNYYTPTFVEELYQAASISPGVIYWDMVHSHYHYSYFKCRPAYCQIDMGAFATRRDIAQSIKLNTTYAADGEFIEEIKKKYPDEKLVKINKVLFVHN